MTMDLKSGGNFMNVKLACTGRFASLLAVSLIKLLTILRPPGGTATIG